MALKRFKKGFRYQSTIYGVKSLNRPLYACHRGVYWDYFYLDSFSLRLLKDFGLTLRLEGFGFLPNLQR